MVACFTAVGTAEGDPAGAEPDCRGQAPAPRRADAGGACEPGGAGPGQRVGGGVVAEIPRPYRIVPLSHCGGGLRRETEERRETDSRDCPLANLVTGACYCFSKVRC